MINQHLVGGRICTDYQTYDNGKNKSVSFSVAVPAGFKDQNGDMITDFINCKAWNKNADLLLQYVPKGNQVLLQGSVKTDKTEKGYYTYTLVEKVTFVGTNKSVQKDKNNPESYEIKIPGETKAIENAPTINQITNDDLPF